VDASVLVTGQVDHPGEHPRPLRRGPGRGVVPHVLIDPESAHAVEPADPVDRPADRGPGNQGRQVAALRGPRTVPGMTSTLPRAVDDEGRPTPDGLADPAEVRAPAWDVRPELVASPAGPVAGVDRQAAAGDESPGDWTAEPGRSSRVALASTRTGRVVGTVVAGLLMAAFLVPLLALLGGFLRAGH
jgi:hypothetical protein